MSYDIGILGGRIVDGAGNPWYYGDIGITGKRIEKISTRTQMSRRSSSPGATARSGRA
jgi:N-acyl-D-amino-acid deacylase